MDNDNKRLLTEDEHAAIVADRVSRETASLTEANEALVEEVATLSTAADAKDIEIASLTKAKDEAVTELADFKASVEAEKAAATRADQRTAAVKAALPHLKDDFFTVERASRWSAMESEAFEGYLAEMAALAGQGASTTPPTETAMAGTTPVTPKSTGNLGALFGRTAKKEG